MGDIADMMLDGTLCQVCGEYMGEGDGFPVTCKGCGGNEWENEDFDGPERPRPKEPKIECSLCGRKVRPNGMPQHLRDKHGV